MTTPCERSQALACLTTNCTTSIDDGDWTGGGIMLKRALAASLSAAIIVAALASSVAHAQFRIPTIPGIPAPAPQQNATPDGPKTMGTMLQEREQRLQQANRRSSIIGTIAGLAGAAACGAFRTDVSEQQRVLCAAAGALLGYGSYLLSNEIQRRLHAGDQRRLLQAASESLRTGEPTQLDFPDSSATGSVTPAGTPTTREAAVDVFYDSARVTNLEAISVVAQPVSWNRRLDIRDTPTTSGRSTGAIAPNSVFYISGRTAASENWYMVSQRVRDGDSEAFMVVGYINMDEVRPAAEADLTVEPVPATLAEGRVQATMQCDALTFQVRDERGRTVDDTSTRCRGPEGTLLSA